MYLEKKKITGEVYNYLKIAVRYENRVRTKTIAYLGKGEMTKEQIERELFKYKNKAEEVKNRTLEELKNESKGVEKMFLEDKEIDKIKEIKRDFKERLKRLDEKTKEDMYNDFITLYAYNTNAIEGNTFTLRETDLLLNKGITPQGKSIREANDHLNAKEVFGLIFKEKIKINHDNIIKIHSMLMKNIDPRMGGYRTQNVRVIGARFKSSPAEYVKIDMNILLKWYRKNENKLPALILAAVFHHKFEKIHPFFDGNGRTGRMFLNIILMQNNLPPLIVPDARRKSYYKALAGADEGALDKIEPEEKEIARFCYFNLLKTYNTIFKRWG